MIKTFIVVASLLLTSTISMAADQLKFSWNYNTPTEISGFRLYRDGQTVDTDNIPATATTITVARQTDKKSHAYHLVAFSDTEESGPSQIAIDEYSIKVQSVGSLTFEIIKN